MDTPKVLCLLHLGVAELSYDAMVLEFNVKQFLPWVKSKIRNMQQLLSVLTNILPRHRLVWSLMRAQLCMRSRDLLVYRVGAHTLSSTADAMLPNSLGTSNARSPSC